MIDLIITGGQSGSDQAGWRAAKAAGIPTVGWMPKGFLTEDGPRPEFAAMYGAIETLSPSYPERTKFNVDACDSLVWFGDNKSPGGKLTIGQCRLCKKPYAIVYEPSNPKRTPEMLANWIDTHCNGRLCIAGNRESRSPGIGEWVEKYLAEVFRILKGQ